MLDQDRLTHALQSAVREVHAAHDTIANLQVQLADDDQTIAGLRLHISRLEHLLLQHSQPIPNDMTQQAVGQEVV